MDREKGIAIEFRIASIQRSFSLHRRNIYICVVLHHRYAQCGRSPDILSA
jgi:hypothetical protein